MTHIPIPKIYFKGQIKSVIPTLMHLEMCFVSTKHQIII